MTVQRKLEIGFAALLVIGLTIFLYMTVKEHEARIRAEVTTEQLDKQTKTSKDDIAVLQKAMDLRDQANQKQLETLTTLIASIKTTQQAVAAIPKVANSPLPAQPYVAQATVSAAAPAVRPGDVIIPQESAGEMWKQYADDKVCRQMLETTTADLVTQKQIVVEKDKEVVSQKKKADTWEQTAKGGTKLHRFLNAAKHEGIGVVIGVVLKFLIK